jgi:thiamine-phosphate pyrophosphorylase
VRRKGVGKGLLLYAMLSWLRGYYAIVNVDLTGRAATAGDAVEPRAVAARAERLLAARPCCLQLRAKGADARALLELAAPLGDLCRRAAIPFCVNDRLDVALAVGADVVHLGQDDLPLEDARRMRELAGARGLVIGFSTHNIAQARAAAEGGADYIGFGPVFGTASKARPDPTVGLAALGEVCRAVRVPVVAIGGIGLDDAAAVAAAGAAAAAIIAAIDRAPDPAAAGQRVAAAFA